MTLPIVPWCPDCKKIAAQCSLAHPLHFVDAQVIPPEAKTKTGWMWERGDYWLASPEHILVTEVRVLVVELE